MVTTYVASSLESLDYILSLFLQLVIKPYQLFISSFTTVCMWWCCLCCFSKHLLSSGGLLVNFHMGHKYYLSSSTLRAPFEQTISQSLCTSIEVLLGLSFLKEIADKRGTISKTAHWKNCLSPLSSGPQVSRTVIQQQSLLAVGEKLGESSENQSSFSSSIIHSKRIANESVDRVQEAVHLLNV